MTQKYCTCCGVEVSGRMQYCPTCRTEKNRERIADLAQKRRAYKAAHRDDTEHEPQVYEQEYIPLSPSLSIAEINRRARKQGLSYGQMVAKMKNSKGG